VTPLHPPELVFSQRRTNGTHWRGHLRALVRMVMSQKRLTWGAWGFTKENYRPASADVRPKLPDVTWPELRISAVGLAHCLVAELPHAKSYPSSTGWSLTS